MYLNQIFTIRWYVLGRGQGLGMTSNFYENNSLTHLKDSNPYFFVYFFGTKLRKSN